MLSLWPFRRADELVRYTVDAQPEITSITSFGPMARCKVCGRQIQFLRLDRKFNSTVTTYQVRCCRSRKFRISDLTLRISRLLKHPTAVPNEPAPDRPPVLASPHPRLPLYKPR